MIPKIQQINIIPHKRKTVVINNFITVVTMVIIQDS